MSLQKCFTELSDALAGYDVSGIVARAAELQKEGMTKRQAEVQAVQEKVNELRDAYRTAYADSIPEPVLSELFSDGLTDESINSIVTKSKMPGLPERTTVGTLASYFDQRIIESFGRRLGQRSGADRQIIARQVANEVRWAVGRQNSGGNWYSSTIDNALAYAAELHPEIATDPVAATAFRLSVAITSNGMDVESNTRLSEEVYSEYKATGKFPVRGQGTTASAMKNSFKLVNEMVEQRGWDAVVDFMNTPMTVRELKDMGVKISGELMDTQVYGSMMFGPKIGAFYQNLSGNYDPITMDRWFMRTWGRYTGTNLPSDKQVSDALSRFRNSLLDVPRLPKGYSKRKIASDDNAAMQLATKAYGEFLKSNFKDKSPLNNAARNLISALSPQIVPRNGKERAWIREVISTAQQQLAAEGVEINSASLQATLWYLEKDLFAANGVAGKRQEATDYEREFRKLVVEKVGEERAADVGQRIQSSQRRAEPHTTRGAADTGVTVLHQGFPYTYELEQEPLKGAKPTRNVPGRGQTPFRPFKAAREAARAYMAKRGLPYAQVEEYVPVVPERASRIAREYDLMEDNIGDPEVLAAYEAMVEETLEQFKAVLDTGLQLSTHTIETDPYGASPSLAILDVVENNHLSVLLTEGAFGTDLETGEQQAAPAIPGNYLNIGMAVTDGDPLTEDDVRRAVRNAGLAVEEFSLQQSDTEQTAVIKTDRALSETELNALASTLKQEAVPQYSDGKGVMAGPKAEAWGDFNPEFFLLPDGGKLSEATVDNPMLRETEFEVDGNKLLVNDVFRIVHDYFGHIKNGVGFRADGEENAWQSHASMYSPLARRAMTTETRGQNSWVNYGPYGEQNRTASGAETVFAPQKMGLLPLWVSEEGHVNGRQVADTDGRRSDGELIRPPVKGGRITLSHFSKTEGIERLDPAYYGSNYAGAEKRRAGGADWVPRTYYGIAPRTPGGYIVESGVGNVQYTTSIDASLLYDMTEDPLNLATSDLNKYEKAIRDAGYSGYFRKHPQLGMSAAVFDPLQTEKLNGQPMTLFQNDLTADAEAMQARDELQAWMDSVSDEEIEFDVDLQETMTEVWEDEAYLNAIEEARDRAEKKIVDHARNEYGYEGVKGTEAAEWIAGMKKFGPEGMTFEARMARAVKMGFDVSKVFYHGSPQWTAGPEGITQFYLNDTRDRPYIFVSPDPDFANSFAGVPATSSANVPEEVLLATGGKATTSRPAVFPVFIRNQNILRVGQIYSFENSMDGFGEAALTTNAPAISGPRETYFKVIDKLNDVLIERDVDNFIDYTQQITDFWDVPDGKGGVKAVPLHVGVRWRMTALAKGDWQQIEGDEVIQGMIEELGFDGFTVLEGGDPSLGFKDESNVANVALYNPADIRSVHAVFDPDRKDSPNLLMQRKKKVTRGFIELHPNNERVIKLTEASNLSTFMHEAAHLILEAEKQFAAEYGTTENQREILKMLGVDTFDQITRTEHELFARTFEGYIRTGKAPSRRLADAFAAFARWLGQVYRGIKQLGLPLNEEVTSVFDRLLATEAEIEQVMSDPAYDVMYTTRESAGMTREEWKKYQSAKQARENRASATLYEKLVTELTRRRTKEWAEERAPIIEERIAALKNARVYKAQDSIRGARLDEGALKEAFGVTDLPKEFSKYTRKKDGQDPDLLAEQLNYGSVQEMMEDIKNAPTLREKAKQEAEEFMKLKYGDMLNDGTIEEEARAAAHNEQQGKLLLAEIRALGRTARKPMIDQQELKARAKAMVDKMKYDELDPRRYYRAEVRAATKAGAATTPEAAYDAKLQQLTNHHLYSEARKAQTEMERQRKYAMGVKKRKYRGTQVDPQYINAMKQLVGIYDWRKKPDSARRRAAAVSFNNFLAAQKSAGMQVNLKDLAMIKLLHGETELLPTFDQLTVEEMKGVYDQLKHLRYVGGRIVDAKKQEFVVERNRAIEAADQNGSAKSRENWESERKKNIGFGKDHLIHLFPSLRNLVRTMDKDPGNKPGPFFDMIYRRIAEAENTKQRMLQDVYAKFDSLFANTDLLRLNDNKRSVRTVKKEGGGDWQLSARQRFMLAVYWGTESSREAIRKGFKVTDTDVQKMMSHLDANQLDAVEKFWDLSEYMKPDLFAAAAERDGVAPEELPATPFVVNGKHMKGGHMRLFYGHSEADLMQKIRLDEDPLSTVNFITPGKSGSAIERVGSGGKPVLLDTNNLFRMVEDNVHFIAYAKAGSELQSVYNNPEVRNAIARNFGDGFDRALMQNIQGLTTNYKERELNSAVTAFIRRLRTAKSMMYLAYNVRNTVQQIVSVFPTGAQMGGGKYAKAMLRTYGDWDAAKQFVESKSPQMKARRDALNREHSEMLKRVVVGTRYEAFMVKAKQYGFAPQVAIDTVVAYPAWIETYYDGMNSHGDEQRAIIDADVFVAETIGSGLDIHLGKVMRSNESEFVRMMTLFGSFFNSSVFQRAWKSVGKGQGFLSKASFEALLITPLMMAAVGQIIIADIPKGSDEDDSWWKWMVQTYGSFMGALVPVAGEAVNFFMPGGPRFKPSTVLDDALYSAGEIPGEIKSYLEGNANAYDFASDMLKITGSFLYLPGSGNLVRYLDAAGEEGELPPLTDTYRAIVEGSDKNPR